MNEVENAIDWRCFHCGDVFTDKLAAALHFGADEGKTPACQIKGSEHGLLKALRDAEAQADEAVQRMHDESTDAAKAYHRQRTRHAQSLIAAEEVGYARGLRDARAEAAREVDGWVSAWKSLRDQNATLIASLERKLAEVTSDRDQWKSDWDMYSKAWLRELGGRLFRKQHHIDALVLTTRHVYRWYQHGVRRHGFSELRDTPLPELPRQMVGGDIGCAWCLQATQDCCC